MTIEKTKAIEAARLISGHFSETPNIGIITGTGLSTSFSFLQKRTSLPYGSIPHLMKTTVVTHRGELLMGEFSNQKTIIFNGRFHLYEGHSAVEIVFPIRIMQMLGIRNVILTNASGGLNLAFTAGDIMLITDHINLTGENPLTGRENETFGSRFPDMTKAYSKRLSAIAESAANDSGISLARGVYAGLKGPSLETPAEMRFLKIIGADAVGFSTVCETIAAVQAGMNVLGLSVITNINDPDSGKMSSVEEIIQTAENAAPRLETIIRLTLEQQSCESRERPDIKTSGGKLFHEK